MKIVAIGGGEKTAAITHALELTGAEHPTVLLNPSAASTERSYDKKVAALSTYFGELGVRAAVLHEFGQNPSQDRIQHELGRASLLYTIGGNTPHMIKTMRLHGSDRIIDEAIRHDKIVHAGTSAGALLPFELAFSNVSAQPSKEQWEYEYLKTLGILPGVATAHANQHDPTPLGPRPDTRLEAMIATFPEVTTGYAIDNGAAAVFNDSELYPIHSQKDAHVRVLKRTPNGSLEVQTLE